MGTRGDIYTKDKHVGADLCWDMVVIGFWDPHLMCIFGFHIDDTDTSPYKQINPYLIISQNQ